MQSELTNEIVLWLNTVGLSSGVFGSIGLALFTKVFIVIKPDGSQSWGMPSGMTSEEFKRRNIRTLKIQKYGIPLSYFGITLGFLCQLIVLWYPRIAAL